MGCQAVDFCDLCEARDFCAELAVAPRGRTYSRFRPTTLDRAHHHRVRTFYRVRDALDHHRGGDKSAFSTRCDGGVQHQPSRLPAPRRGSPSGTAPNIPRLARVLPALSPQSLLLTLSPRVSCAARPHVRRPSAARERSALWWRHELLCHRLSAAKGFCQRHTPPFPDRPSNQNGKATLASPARRLPETCAHRTVAYMERGVVR